ncbi:MAG TPA: hypothetical protein VFK21_12455 [Gammaproteobacteria bacterium]|nr:hypothetical protein [Gammaproteobacteria bacterium]
MKKIILTALLGAILGSGLVLAAEDHPNLRAAKKLVHQAMEDTTAAQKDNHFDMKGHAEAAKKLMKQAEEELNQAVGAANKNKK